MIRVWQSSEITPRIRQILLEKRQEQADQRYAVEMLDYEIDGLQQELAELVATLEGVDAALHKSLGQRRATEAKLAENETGLRENRAEWQIREEMGAGKTKQLLTNERESLERAQDRLGQTQRMVAAEVARLEGEQAAAVARRASLEGGLRERGGRVVAGLEALKEAARVLHERDTLERGVRDAEVRP